MDSGRIPHLFLNSVNGLAECWPATDGSWNTDLIVSGPDLAWFNTVAALSTGPGELWLFSRKVLPGTPQAVNVIGFHKLAGAWQAPQVLLAIPSATQQLVDYHE